MSFRTASGARWGGSGFAPRRAPAPGLAAVTDDAPQAKISAEDISTLVQSGASLVASIAAASAQRKHYKRREDPAPAPPPPRAVAAPRARVPWGPILLATAAAVAIGVAFSGSRNRGDAGSQGG